MTIFGWDASHWDWGRGPMDIRAAAADGIVFMTHKAIDKTSRNDRYDDFARRARGAIPLLGAYAVNHPGDQRPQVDAYIATLDAVSPWWREGPFVVQLDAERFDYMPREPNLTEIRQWCDYFVARTGGRWRPVVYAPRWLYGDRLIGLPYPLWQSNYGSNPAVHYRQAYPGDGSSRWAPYSGQTPAILQYGSRTIIGTQHTCDANAFRGTFQQLTALVFTGGEDDELQPLQIAQISNNERYQQSTVAMTDTVVGLSNTVNHNISVDNHLVRTLKRIEAAIAGLDAQIKAIAAKVDLDPAELEAVAEAARQAAFAGAKEGATGTAQDAVADALRRAADAADDPPA